MPLVMVQTNTWRMKIPDFFAMRNLEFICSPAGPFASGDAGRNCGVEASATLPQPAADCVNAARRALFPYLHGGPPSEDV